MTSDNKTIRVKATDIEKLEKSKDSDYQISGVDSDNETKLSIKDTPFDLDQDK